MADATLPQALTSGPITLNLSNKLTNCGVPPAVLKVPRVRRALREGLIRGHRELRRPQRGRRTPLRRPRRRPGSRFQGMDGISYLGIK